MLDNKFLWPVLWPVLQNYVSYDKSVLQFDLCKVCGVERLYEKAFISDQRLIHSSNAPDGVRRLLAEIRIGLPSSVLAPGLMTGVREAIHIRMEWPH